MTKTHTIDLDPDDQLEDFELDNNNLACITVDVKGDQALPRGEGYRVILSLSATAMIGFGTELIRKGKAALAQDLVLNEEPITPISKHESLLYNDLGFFLVPGSADLIFCLKDFGTIEEAKINETNPYNRPKSR
jgi:hypothetical protein